MINGKKLIEIRKLGFINKGAELMLYAILEKMRKEFPDAKFAMVSSLSTGNAAYLKRAELGLYQKAHIWRKGVQFGILANLIPAKIREVFGIVLDKEVDIVIDGAGFLYSDQMGKYSCLELSNSCKRWKRNGTKVILLPQAFGPFESYYNRKAIKATLDCADLVFAREKASYDYLVDVCGERSNLKMAADFTNLVEGIVPDQFDQEVNRFCIIPNYRMIDKTKSADSKAYLPFMVKVTRYALEKGQKPFLLVHEGANDLMLAENIRDAVDQDIQIIKEDNPLKIKGILGVSSGTVGSRFHGLVSALSQGTPALATGWSHKYQMLFEDYGFPEGMLNVHMEKEELQTTMDLILDETNKLKVVGKLKLNSQRLKQETDLMWTDVINALKG
jgi:polysaccharide pyruvyl transferase WcaK-like protein